MIKKIFLLSLFFYTLFIAAKLSPISADFCAPAGYCLGSHSSNMVYYTGCKFYTSHPGMGGNYCGNDGYTGDSCQCTNPNTCTCTTHSWDNGDYGKSCELTPGAVGTCYCQEGGDSCESNVDCREYLYGEDRPPYPYDVCGCAATGQGCVLVPGSYQRWCCVSGAPPGTPGQPTNTPGGPTQTPLRQLTIEINVFRAPSASYNQVTNSCTASTPTTYEAGAWVFLDYPPNTPKEQQPLINNHVTFSLLEVTEGEELNIRVMPNDSNYFCLCPSDCTYALTVPPVGTDVISRNVYLSNLASSWWQVFGGNTFVNATLKSIVPDYLCTSPACLAGVFLPLPSQSVLTSGFPFLHGTTLNSSTISTHQNAGENLANIHLAGQRTTAQSADGVVLGFTPAASLDYNYFYQLAANNGTINKVTSTPLNLAAWRAEHNDDIHGLTIFELSGDQAIRTISQNNNLFVQNGEKIVIFVDGNLTIEDNQSGGGHKITTVAAKTSSEAGGFLGIFVKGNITIGSSVGTALDTSNPETITPVNITNAHLEGVFFSNGNLVIEGDNNNYPNYKFIGAGTFVGKAGVTLGRQTNDDTKIHNNYQALENFIYRSDLLVNWPNELKSSIINWREVAPKSFN